LVNVPQYNLDDQPSEASIKHLEAVQLK
jgi:hypothetical protein